MVRSDDPGRNRLPDVPGFAAGASLGQGRYRGTQLSLDRPAQLIVGTGPPEAFVETWRTVGELEHPAVVPVLDAGTADGIAGP